MNLEGKTVLVTGSTRGIGLAMAHAFDAAGANVILHGRSAPKPEVLAEFSENTMAITADIADEASVKEALDGLFAEVKGIDILVNNAGIVNDKLAMGMKPADFAQVVNTNLNGTFNVTQPIFKKMLRARTGQIINIASVVGLMGNVGQANYAASKAGIVGLTKTLAKEGAMRGIRVNAIAPGMIVSDMTNALSDKVKDQVLEAIPLNRFGEATEIANTAVFLAQNDYITGQTITVDGGLYI
ncbi:3-oxoacyl-ACP reductase family protein [Weissella bombi]|uniref:3-oxoacyl-[acyl-carrier protein] reductase n=1 Tax=Weissella bombi TaxID=1505725 RepID=A0A1C4AFX6_9LACO|nr:3-oxoacyl-ACP reductase family protein [Weissella bombi]SCB93562.1 3-oxoacyl-[acyl-carrier protein] reductase [Weissella bombi]